LFLVLSLFFKWIFWLQIKFLQKLCVATILHDLIHYINSKSWARFWCHFLQYKVLHSITI
jgi:hypothetical protein